MKKTFSCLFLLLATSVFAIDREEEAVILNQELQYLKDSSKIPAIRASAPTPALGKDDGPRRTLEETYFGDDKEDTVSTKTAARRRRQAN